MSNRSPLDELKDTADALRNAIPDRAQILSGRQAFQVAVLAADAVDGIVKVLDDHERRISEAVNVRVIPTSEGG